MNIIAVKQNTNAYNHKNLKEAAKNSLKLISN